MSIQVTDIPDTLQIPQELMAQVLDGAEIDTSVMIRHAALMGDHQYRLHVAGIVHRVGCHVHFEGDEDYAIMQGRGLLHWGKVDSKEALAVKWEQPIPVSEGDAFIVPEGYAHQLENVGDGELVILFACPDAHLDDLGDRTLLADAPTLGAMLSCGCHSADDVHHCKREGS